MLPVCRPPIRQDLSPQSPIPLYLTVEARKTDQSFAYVCCTYPLNLLSWKKFSEFSENVNVSNGLCGKSENQFMENLLCTFLSYSNMGHDFYDRISRFC